jgi:hypothetical protein
MPQQNFNILSLHPERKAGRVFFPLFFHLLAFLGGFNHGGFRPFDCLFDRDVTTSTGVSAYFPHDVPPFPKGD